MWIKHVILENFASIKVGMKTDRLELDFNNRENKICLLVAPNGYGKTSLLSTLTPFATLGDLDVRNSNGVIIDDKDGYKEIEIISGDDDYLIKHFYTKTKTGHSVKSYISKNGEELNVNGNVTSFKAIVEEELEIDISYLKLIRLGNNVTNMLDLTATERKKFLSNLLSELDIYLKLYKKLTEDSRILKVQISHISDKIKKTGIVDIGYSKNSLIKLAKSLENNKKDYDSLTSNLGYLEGLMKDTNISDIKDEYNTISKKLNKISSVDIRNISIDDIDKSIDDVRSSLETHKLSLATLSNELTGKLNELDSKLRERDDVTRQIDKIENNETIKGIISRMKTLEISINKSESLYTALDIKYTKDELSDFILVLRDIDRILDKTYELGKESVKKVISMRIDGKSVDDYVNKGYVMIENKSSELLDKLIRDGSDIDMSCNHHNCGLYRLYQEIIRLKNIEDHKFDVDNNLEHYKYIDSINTNINEVFNRLKECSDIIDRLPDHIKEDFRYGNIYNRIIDRLNIVDYSKYQDLLSDVTEYTIYLNNTNEYNELKLKLDSFKELNSLDYFKDRLSTINLDISNVRVCIDNLRDNLIESEKSKVNLCEDKLSELLETRDSVSNFIDYNNRAKELNSIISDYDSNMSEYTSLKHRLEDIKYIIDRDTNIRESMVILIDEYKKLTKDLNRYSKLYNQNEYIKKAMSSKEGIPLEHINMYMSDIKSIINDLLDLVYDGSIYIKDFNINSDEFKIPYIKDGYMISDIISASQGETAFLSIALSFALIYKSISKYNILLLDEMDSNLDKNYREKFLSILERLMDMVDCEQIFLISHNNMFSMYPVDIVPLDGKISEDYKLGNYILPEV